VERRGLAASGWSGPGQFLALFAHAGEEGEDFAGGGSLAGGPGQWQVRLDLVAVAAAVLFLDDVAATVRSVTIP
jgi:hypothetical protein